MIRIVALVEFGFGFGLEGSALGVGVHRRMEAEMGGVWGGDRRRRRWRYRGEIVKRRERR